MKQRHAVVACILIVSAAIGVDALQSKHIPPESFLSGVKADTERSTKWHSLRNRIIKEHPFCAYCGSSTKLQAHHVKPFHLHPELELDPNNVIVLCENPETDHHLHIGHLGNFKSENPNVVEDCKKNEAKLRAAGLWPRD